MKGLLTSLITVLTFTGLQAQSLPSAPKLVVGLTIDQLRTDYLEAFSSLYGEKGFKRLWKEGRVFHNAEYTFCGVDRASAIAAIYSGTTPSMNGIISQRWMDASTLRPVNSTDDTAFMGYYTDQTAAPTKLLTSTIADELKIATQGKGLVYAIAPDCDAALFAAGHAGNGAFWLNPNTGKWSGTTYYGEFPWWASQYNDRQAIDFRIAGMTWEPVFPRGMYTFLPDWRDILFKYKFDDDRNNKYRRFIASPFVNDEVNALAEEALNKSSIGMDDITDLLALTYYAGKVEGPNGTIKLDDGTDLEYVPSEITLDLSGKASEKTAGARMKKYELDASATNDGKLQSNDIVLFRYADVLLMKSEAKVRNGGNGDAELTEVRERAGATLDVTATLETLLEERLREFAWEGLRRQDLVRFGKFTRAYTDRPQLPKEDTGYTTVFPIHEDVLSLNGKLTQNYGY